MTLINTSISYLILLQFLFPNINGSKCEVCALIGPVTNQITPHYHYSTHSSRGYDRTHPWHNQNQRVKLFDSPTISLQNSLQSNANEGKGKSIRSLLPLDLITFDLDDTLFPIEAVLKDANDAMLTHLISTIEQRRKKMNLVEKSPFEVTNEDIFAYTKQIRNNLLQEGQTDTYTNMRKLAIATILCDSTHEKLSTAEHAKEPRTVIPKVDSTVVEIYNTWERERHAAAERHLYQDAIDALVNIKLQHPDVVIGAITNGKANPLLMKRTLSSYFDFCISGEDDGIFPHRKPSPIIYDKALEAFRKLERGNAISSDVSDLCWIHVGDDLANDVGGSAKCGALAIWADLSMEYQQTSSKRLILDKFTSGQTTSPNGQSQKAKVQQPSWSTLSQEEIRKRTQMAEKATAFVSARIENLSSLPPTIQRILDEGIKN
mmetsp:Transcript_7988/g.11400  ORF Transcript_7988/g.11400 Transcript_7988/m.11400 type:complete len:432 (+) Transcript_7988:154-1449(+)